jgi:multidrug efflux system membrane fusion protein
VETQASLVRQAQGTVQADQAQVDSARLQLSYTKVVAPISGRLGLRQVDPGNMIRSSDATGLVVITQVQPITVTYAIPQDSLQAILKRIASGDKLAVEAWDREGKKKLATGVLLTLDNQIDTATGTIKLKAEFANADNALFPNQFVNVRMRLDTLAGVTLVPGAAVQRGSPGTFVYLVKDDGSVTLRPVKLGVTEGDNVAVESGLAPGDRVVVDGGDKLREGAKVEVIVRENLDAPRKGRPGGAGKGGPGKGGDGARQGKKDGAPQPGDAAPAKDAKAPS